LQVVVGVATPLALTSIGGLGIYAAPVLLPLLWITAAASGRVGRWYFTILAALLVGEVTWAITWSLAPALQLVGPIAAMVLTPILFFRTFRDSLDFRASVLVVAILGLVGLSGIASLTVGSSTTSREVSFERVER